MTVKMSRAKARLAFSMVLLLIAAGAALVLGCVGLYGVVSYAMRQRIPEMAVRMALGARPRDIRGMVLADGLLVGAAGIAAGLAGSALLTRLMKAVLYQVSPFDPLVFAAATALPFAVFLTLDVPAGLAGGGGGSGDRAAARLAARREATRR